MSVLAAIIASAVLLVTPPLADQGCRQADRRRQVMEAILAAALEVRVSVVWGFDVGEGRQYIFRWEGDRVTVKLREGLSIMY